MDGYSFPNRVRRSSLELANPNHQLFVTGLPSSIDEQNLIDIFSKFGEIQSCKILAPARQNTLTNDATVTLSSHTQAQNAIDALNGAPTSQGILEVIARPTAASEPSSQPLFHQTKFKP
jgi:RNA recognition motif-containing protein